MIKQILIVTVLVATVYGLYSCPSPGYSDIPSHADISADNDCSIMSAGDKCTLVCENGYAEYRGTAELTCVQGLTPGVGVWASPTLECKWIPMEGGIGDCVDTRVKTEKGDGCFYEGNPSAIAFCDTACREWTECDARVVNHLENAFAGTASCKLLTSFPHGSMGNSFCPKSDVNAMELEPIMEAGTSGWLQDDIYEYKAVSGAQTVCKTKLSSVVRVNFYVNGITQENCARFVPGLQDALQYRFDLRLPPLINGGCHALGDRRELEDDVEYLTDWEVDMNVPMHNFTSVASQVEEAEFTQEIQYQIIQEEPTLAALEVKEVQKVDLCENSTGCQNGAECDIRTGGCECGSIEEFYPERFTGEFCEIDNQVDCVGEWGECDLATCEQTYAVTTFQRYGGALCEAWPGDKKTGCCPAPTVSPTEPAADERDDQDQEDSTECPADNECTDHGVCHVDATFARGYRCDCIEGWRGMICQRRPNVNFDKVSDRNGCTDSYAKCTFNEQPKWWHGYDTPCARQCARTSWCVAYEIAVDSNVCTLLSDHEGCNVEESTRFTYNKQPGVSSIDQVIEGTASEETVCYRRHADSIDSNKDVLLEVEFSPCDVSDCTQLTSIVAGASSADPTKMNLADAVCEAQDAGIRVQVPVEKLTAAQAESLHAESLFFGLAVNNDAASICDIKETNIRTIQFDNPCEGEWSECDAACRSIYDIFVPKKGDGVDCAYPDGEEKVCDLGEGECGTLYCSSPVSTDDMDYSQCDRLEEGHACVASCKAGFAGDDAVYQCLNKDDAIVPLVADLKCTARPDPCVQDRPRDQCTNGSTCVTNWDKPMGFECICKEGYSGRICQKKNFE